MAKFVNCTPHAITLILNNHTQTLEPSGSVPRVSALSTTLPSIELENDGIFIPITKSVLGELTGLPPIAPNTFYITSLLVAQKAKELGRSDVLSPNVVRDDKGNIIGCNGFVAP